MVETILFDIKFSIIGNPIIEIFIDDAKMTDTKFYHSLEFGLHELRIVHKGKTNATPDQFVKIESIVIDGVNIRDIIYTDSINTPEYPEPWATIQRKHGVELEEKVIGQHELGFNCVWRLPFTSPFYEFVMNHVR
jgi:hypothetical protein